MADLLPAGDVRVVKEGERYYLTSPLIDNPAERRQFYEIAPDVLMQVNGHGRAHNPSFRPVKLTMTFLEDDRLHHVVQAETIEVRGKAHAVAVVTSADGEPTPQPPPVGPQHAAVVGRDANVAQVLAVMGQPTSLGWVELYKVFEIVRASGVLPTRVKRPG